MGGPVGMLVGVVAGALVGMPADMLAEWVTGQPAQSPGYLHNHTGTQGGHKSPQAVWSANSKT